jgi:hypothetical protein
MLPGDGAVAAGWDSALLIGAPQSPQNVTPELSVLPHSGQVIDCLISMESVPQCYPL